MPPLIVFPPFTLDPVNELVSRGGAVLSLRPKAFAVLRYLAERPGQLVTKDELLAAIWAGTFVSDTVLKVCMTELRQALGDDAGTPHVIQTVHRRGYRFIAPMVGDADGAMPAPPAPEHLVGRDAERRRLDEALKQARSGTRQVVFVSGEAGLGKTALVDAFLLAAMASKNEALWVARGQCVAQYGAGEAFLPMLEALDRLCRGSDGARVVDLMRRLAPDWLLQLPALVPEEERADLKRQSGATGPERMVRLVIDLLEALSADRTLILVLEDMHWSDPSTVDLLARLAERRERAHLLVLATYRPAEAIARSHPLRTVKQELQVRGRCAEIALGFLNEQATREYLEARFSGGPLPAGLVGWLQHRTDGNPLFMVNVVEELVAQHLVADVDGRPVAEAGFERVGVPENLRQMIELQLDRVDPSEQELLEAAAVAGAEFSAATVAAAVGADVVDVEARLRAWARRGQLVRDSGLAVWPDGAVAAQLAFVHSLYREVQYQRIAPARRVQLHRRIGDRLVAACGSEPPKAPAELALHFEECGDLEKAVAYLRETARQARRRHAHREAAGCLAHAIELLRRQPATTERTGELIALHLRAVPSLVATKGMEHPEVKEAYDTALALAETIGDTVSSWLALAGIWGVHSERAEYDAASQVSARLSALTSDIPPFRLAVHAMVGVDAFHRGDLEPAAAAFEQALATGAVYPPGMRPDPTVLCLGFSSLALCLLGRVEDARRRDAEARAAAEAHPDGYDRALVLMVSALLGILLRDPSRATPAAERAESLAREYELPLGEDPPFMRAWCRAAAGDPIGVAEMERCVAEVQARGVRRRLSIYLALLAEQQLAHGRPRDALDRIDAAGATIEATEERVYEAEIHRLRGECSRALAPSAAGRRRAVALSEAERCFTRALEVARRQGARWWELRAAMSLAELRLDQQRAEEGHLLLAPVYDGFTGGLDARDLRDAKALLDRLR